MRLRNLPYRVFLFYRKHAVTFSLPSIDRGMHRKDNPKREHTVFCFEIAHPLIALGDGADAAAAIAMVFPAGYRQTVLHVDFACVGISDFKEQPILL